MSRKITKKQLLNLYQDRVEMEDDLRERDHQERAESYARADDRKDQMIKAIGAIAPQLLTLAMQSYSTSAASQNERLVQSDLVDDLFEHLEASPEKFRTFMDGMDPSVVASIAELHRQVVERRGHVRTPSPVPVGGWTQASPYAPMVGGLVEPQDLQKVAGSSGKIAWMLQNLTAGELSALASINKIAQERRYGVERPQAQNSQPDTPAAS